MHCTPCQFMKNAKCSSSLTLLDVHCTPQDKILGADNCLVAQVFLSPSIGANELPLAHWQHVAQRKSLKSVLEELQLSSLFSGTTVHCTTTTACTELCLPNGVCHQQSLFTCVPNRFGLQDKPKRFFWHSSDNVIPVVRAGVLSDSDSVKERQPLVYSSHKELCAHMCTHPQHQTRQAKQMPRNQNCQMNQNCKMGKNTQSKT